MIMAEFYPIHIITTTIIYILFWDLSDNSSEYMYMYVYIVQLWLITQKH